MRFKGPSIIFILIAVLTSALTTQAQTISGIPIGCRSENQVFQRMKVSGKILLNQNFLSNDKSINDATINAALELQIKHIMGYFKNTGDSGLNVALSAYRANLKISEAKKVKYGSDFKIDKYLPASRGELSSSKYIQNALQVGNVNLADDAQEIAYTIDLIIADCTKAGFQSLAKIVIPLDPYLSLWIENKENRQARQFGPTRLEEVSNCSSNEIVIFGNADRNWFFWSPEDSKIDAKGKKHLCKIDSSRTYQPQILTIVNVEAPTALTKEFFQDIKTFDFTSIFGIIDSSELFQKTDISKLKAFITSAALECKSAKYVSHCLSKWSQILLAKDGKFFEPGTHYFLIFLKYLYTVVVVDSMTVVQTGVRDDEIWIQYKGRFIDSKMPIKGTVYLGNTTLDYGPRVSKTYVKVLNSAFQDSDSISYVGHAGLGYNFKIDEFMRLWREDRLPEVHRSKPIWEGIYNCEGFSYFGFDQEKIFKKQKMNILLTESSGTESGAKFPLAQLSVLNQIFANQAADIRSTMGRYVQTREFATETRLKFAP